MNRIVPYHKPYELIKRLGLYANILLAVTGVITVFLSFNGFKILDEAGLNIVKSWNIVILILYAGLKIFINYFYLRMETTRRLDFVDNSYNTNFSSSNSQGYFSNNSISPGIYKMATNSFENSFHTHNTLKKTILVRAIWSFPFVVVFLGSAFSGHGNLLQILFEVSLPVYLIQEFIVSCIYFYRIEKVKEEYHSIFSEAKSGVSLSVLEPRMVRNVLNYESAVSWSAMPLS